MSVMMGSSLFLNSAGYQISRSVRLRSSASAYFNRTLTTPTNAARWTFNRWVKRGTIGARQSLFAAGTSGSSYANIEFKADDTIQLLSENSAVQFQLVTTQVFRDPSAWYNIHIIYDSANATSTDRIQLWINGVRVTAFSTATYPTTPNNLFNTAIAHQIGVLGYGSVAYFDGYQTELNFIDGQALTPASFGSTNATTGVWQPIKYTGTYGTNGFYLNFSDNSAATAAAIGKDYSGNGNNWTPNNISVTAGVTYDSMLDVPTQWADGGNGRGNYATLNPIGAPFANGTVTDGNLKFAGLTTTDKGVAATIAISSGTFYWESTQLTNSGSSNCYTGVITTGASSDVNANRVYVRGDGIVYKYGTSLGTVFPTFTNNDVIGLAYDRANNTLAIYKNGTLGYTVTGLNNADHTPWVGGYTTTDTWATNFGQRPFAYTPPTGFKALNTLNLPTPTILKGNQYFDTNIWNGQNTSLSITNSGAMQPDFVWIKKRNGATDHNLTDAVRGTNKNLISNSTAAEDTAARLTSFDTGGFTLGGAFDNTNLSGSTYVGWQWNAGGSTVTNTSGSISAQVRANPTAGFSVVTYTGNATSGATVGHGLGVAPSLILLKVRNAVARWVVYQKNVTTANNQFLELNSTAAVQTSGTNMWTVASIDGTTFGLGTNADTNGSTLTFVAYCFSVVAGYSAFGSYTGNGSADGPFVFLGFRPRWILTKAASGATGSWWLYDTARSTYNEMTDLLRPDLSNADTTQGFCDALSNGFKIRNSGNNTNGATYIYAAFAENPFKNALAR